MKFKLSLITLILFVLPIAPSHAQCPIASNELAFELQQELNDGIKKVVAPGGAMAVRDKTGRYWSGGAGVTNLTTNQSATATSRFRIWSVSKTMTAAIVLQLVDEGKIKLSDHLSQWFPDFPKGSEIEIQHLLSHTSGIPDYFSYVDVVPYWSSPLWTAEAMIKVGAAIPRTFEPGEDWLYSNTNLVLLGRIVEMVTSKTLASQLRSRLFDRFGLKNTFISGEEFVPGGYFGYQQAGGQFVDVTSYVHPSVTWATGAVVTSAEDLRKWAEVLFEGDVLSPGLRKQMMTPVSLKNGKKSVTGLGVIITESPQGTVYSHGGGPLWGGTASVLYVPKIGIVKAVIVNSGSPFEKTTLESINALGIKSLLK